MSVRVTVPQGSVHFHFFFQGRNGHAMVQWESVCGVRWTRVFIGNGKAGRFQLFYFNFHCGAATSSPSTKAFQSLRVRFLSTDALCYGMPANVRHPPGGGGGRFWTPVAANQANFPLKMPTHRCQKLQPELGVFVRRKDSELHKNSTYGDKNCGPDMGRTS